MSHARLEPLKKPKAALRIGVVGQTTFADEEGVKRALRSCLEQVCVAARAIFAAARDPDRPAESGILYEDTDNPEFRLITSLAPGADQLGVAVALEKGFGSFSFVLPHDEKVYAERQRDAANLRKFLEIQANVEALVLDGGAETQEDIQAADRTASRIVVEHSDILIAVWHGFEVEACRRGSSITYQAILDAHRRGVPVIWIAAPSPGATADSPRVSERGSRRRGRELGWFVGHGPFDAGGGFQDDLEQELRVLLDPYVECREKDVGSSSRTEEEMKKCREQLKLFTMASTPSARVLGCLRDFVETPIKWVWQQVVYGLARRCVAASAESRGQPASHPGVLRVRDCVEDHYRRADALATHCMDLYRGTFCATFLLGGFTVFFAALAYLLKREKHWLGTPFGILEIGAVTAILLLFACSRWRKWHMRAIDCRLLAELLRHTRWLSLVGSSIPRPQPPVHRHGSGEPLGWPQWYFLAVLRSTGCGTCPSGRSELRIERGYLDAARQEILDGWVQDQCGFHALTHRRYEKLEKWLWRLAVMAFGAVFVACIVSVVLALVHWSVLLIVTAFPAFAAAFHGIDSQAELKRLGEAYSRMQRELDVSAKRIQALGADFALDDLHPPAWEAGVAMLNELDDWHVAHRTHVIPLP
jgi:hypothetical protein